MTDMLVTTEDQSWEMEAETVPRAGEDIVIGYRVKGKLIVVSLTVITIEWNGTELPGGRYRLKPWVRCRLKAVQK